MTFQPGHSGNPNGRPKGIIDRRAELRGLLEPHAKEIVDKLIEFAKAGDPTALKLCIERLIPRVKPDTGINFELPEGCIDHGENMLKIAHDITVAVACGSLTIEEAEKFTEFLKHQRCAIEEAKQKKKDEIWERERDFSEGS
ncbi:MAG: hypothetical protein A3F12_02775 [Gammaproteobacteria bacterium RIFCSPHIGHO2_12_FULL_38_14]|nr:MAG: hypothetical protein A3F12_02775 [Gammaproteobacteria bacterium RIFCSPHIGHO2_12_FULL_38_14]